MTTRTAFRVTVLTGLVLAFAWLVASWLAPPPPEPDPFTHIDDHDMQNDSVRWMGRGTSEVTLRWRESCVDGRVLRSLWAFAPGSMDPSLHIATDTIRARRCIAVGDTLPALAPDATYVDTLNEYRRLIDSMWALENWMGPEGSPWDLDNFR